MNRHAFIFIAGLHRSGTSLLHELVREHPLVSGFRNTGVPEDEGQHLQTVFPPAKAFGGPGSFAFNRESWMDENHPLATSENARELFRQWSLHHDLSRRYLIEKSPPNLVRTRFLQRLFPGSRFIVILRHPAVVALATQKWSDSSLASLIGHSLLGYEVYRSDCARLAHVHELRYEDLVESPARELDRVFRFMGVASVEAVPRRVDAGRNAEYLARWPAGRDAVLREIGDVRFAELASRAARFGYRLDD